MEKEQLIDAVRDWFDENDLSYEFDAEREVIRSGFDISCKLRNLRFFVTFCENGFTVVASAPVQGDPNDLGQLMRYLHQANYGLRNGNFELDVRDGEVRYKCWVSSNGLDSIPSDIIASSVFVPCSMMERYGDGIAALAMGFSDADTEIEKAEKPKESDD